MMEWGRVRCSRELYLGSIAGETYKLDPERGVPELVVPLHEEKVWPYITNGPLELVESAESRQDLVESATPAASTQDGEEVDSQSRNDGSDDEGNSASVEERVDRETAHTKIKQRHTKDELAAKAQEELDINLDKRKRKDSMIEDLLDELDDVAEVFQHWL